MSATYQWPKFVNDAEFHSAEQREHEGAAIALLEVGDKVAVYPGGSYTRDAVHSVGVVVRLTKSQAEVGVGDKDTTGHRYLRMYWRTPRKVSATKWQSEGLDWGRVGDAVGATASYGNPGRLRPLDSPWYKVTAEREAVRVERKGLEATAYSLGKQLRMGCRDMSNDVLGLVAAFREELRVAMENEAADEATDNAHVEA